MKRLMGRRFGTMADVVDEAIAEKLGLPAPWRGGFHHPAVKAADNKALLMEASKLKVSQGVGAAWGNDRTLAVHYTAVQGFDPQWAEALFLAAHARLAGGVRA
jgi:hypothetical protein